MKIIAYDLSFFFPWRNYYSLPLFIHSYSDCIRSPPALLIFCRILGSYLGTRRNNEHTALKESNPGTVVVVTSFGSIFQTDRSSQLSTPNKRRSTVCRNRIITRLLFCAAKFQHYSAFGKNITWHPI